MSPMNYGLWIYWVKFYHQQWSINRYIYAPFHPWVRMSGCLGVYECIFVTRIPSNYPDLFIKLLQIYCNRNEHHWSHSKQVSLGIQHLQPRTGEWIISFYDSHSKYCFFYRRIQSHSIHHSNMRIHHWDSLITVHEHASMPAWCAQRVREREREHAGVVGCMKRNRSAKYSNMLWNVRLIILGTFHSIAPHAPSCHILHIDKFSATRKYTTHFIFPMAECISAIFLHHHCMGDTRPRKLHTKRTRTDCILMDRWVWLVVDAVEISYIIIV